MGVKAGAATAGVPVRKTVMGDLLGGAVSGFTAGTFALSLAALIFSGRLAVVQQTGFVAMFTTCLVLGLGMALLSSLPFTSAAPDSYSGVILAATAAQIAQVMGPAASAAALGATILMMLMLSAIVLGAILAALGLLRAGRFFRFIPYQVMAGFLGAAGFSLTVGALSVGIGAPLHWETFASPDAQAKLAATVGFAAVLALVAPRARSPFALPGLVLGAVAVHHAVAAGLGVAVETQRNLGWLVTAPAHLSVALPWSPTTLGLVDWHALEVTAPGLIAVMLVSVMSLMLGVSALEVATAHDADIDRELLAGGISMAASGLLGGSIGTVAMTRSVLMLRAGATTRLAPCASAVVAGLLPLLVPSALGLVPRPVLGGLLVFLGLQLVNQWVVRSRLSLSRAEWVTVLLVVAVTVRFGFVTGVFVGIALGCATFAAAYGRAAPTRARYRGDVATSNVARPAADRALLQADAAALLVLHLQGFLFFGTATRLLQDVRAEIAAHPGRLRTLVLDFQNVDGIDGSAASSFARIAQLAETERIAVVVTAMAPDVEHRLTRIPAVAAAAWRSFETLDQGLEWWEETRLGELRSERAELVPMQDQLAATFGDPAMAARFVARLEPLSVAAGTVLMRQHDRAEELMFVESGRVNIILQIEGGAEVRARSMGVGAMIGEIGFLLGEPRTASVVADTDCRVLCLRRTTLRQIEHDDPELGFAFHRAMGHFLAHRLIDKDGMIAALMRVAR